jgi:AraC-like DNA-binding protein
LTTAISEYKKPFAKSDYAWINEQLSEFTYEERTRATDCYILIDKITNLKTISLCLLARNNNTSGDKKYTDKYSEENKKSLKKIINLMSEVVDSATAYDNHDGFYEYCGDNDACEGWNNVNVLADELTDIMLEGVNAIYFEFNDLGVSVIARMMTFTYDKIEKIIYNSEEFKNFKELQRHIEKSYLEQCESVCGESNEIEYICGEIYESVEIELIMSDSRYNFEQKKFKISIVYISEYFECVNEMSFLEFMEDWDLHKEDIKIYETHRGWQTCYEEVDFDFSEYMFKYSPNKDLIRSLENKRIVDIFTDILDQYNDDSIRSNFVDVLNKYLDDFEKIKIPKMLDSLMKVYSAKELSKKLDEIYKDLSPDKLEKYQDKLKDIKNSLSGLRIVEKIQSLMLINDSRELISKFYELINNMTDEESKKYNTEFKKITNRIKNLEAKEVKKY